jgi:hypothetical protein
VRLAVRVLDSLDEEIIEFRWGPDWLVWDTEQAKQQYTQHGEYRLRPDLVGTSTTVRVEVTVEPNLLIRDCFIKRAGKTIIDTANMACDGKYCEARLPIKPSRSGCSTSVCAF